ncbi:MAG: hypothetical protein UFD80_09460 [Blautia sp.]|uniref:hypothetical protein n=1 Tax=Blautia sp. TaxID=1955243 RepID=UPI002E765D0C|nr:hypothetical protein [Blautia sp.]MED9882881.1 hypothetical protein [Blautia sp.]
MENAISNAGTWKELQDVRTAFSEAQRILQEDRYTELQTLLSEKNEKLMVQRDSSIPCGTGQKQSVLKALRERQARIKEQKNMEQNMQDQKKESRNYESEI